MNHKLWKPVLRSLALLGLLVGCGTPTAAPATPIPTEAPTATPAPTRAPTATAAPPTPRPTPLAVGPDEIAPKLGVDLGGVGDRALEFVDVAKTLRRWETLDADTCGEGNDACRYAPLDAEGWPTTDARTVFFDKRPFGAWWSQDPAACPHCQDGDFMIDVSGTYRLSFRGQARLTSAEGTVDVRHQTYDEDTNTTTADVVVAPGTGLLFVNFVDTRRTPQHDLNTGITDVHLMRPGYPLDTDQVFTPHILEAVRPFDTLRFMNWVGGNNLNPPYDAEDNTLTWAERTLPTMRQTQGEGVAWEYVVALANLTGKNIWINIPVHASDDYVEGLARLLHDTLHPDAVIYVEHSNEVWNPGFSQHAYNKAAAAAEVAAGESNLDDDGADLEGLWAERRHVRRLVEFSEMFRQVFGDDAINTRVRVVHAWWAEVPTAYEGQLAWVEATYGPPSTYFYAVAAAGYFNVRGIRDSADLDDVFARLRRSSDAHARTARVQLQQIADRYDLRHAMYEAGPDTSKPLQWDRDTELLHTLIAAHRDPRMRDLICYDLWNNWYAHPEIQGDMYIYFTLQSGYNRWGMWGLTEDITDLETPKYRAITDLVGMTASPPPAPLGVTATALGDGRVALTWAASFGATRYTVKRAPAPDGPFEPIAEGLIATTYTDKAAPGGTATYLVVAVNAQGETQSAAVTPRSP